VDVKSHGVALLTAACLLAASGCGASKSRNLPTGHVSGTVTYKTALPEGQVIFQHTTGEAAATKFGPDGKYALDVPVGKNQVMIRSLESSAAAPPAEGAAPGPRAMETYKSRIPERYTDFNTSKLEYDIKEGENPIDIKIEDK